VDGSDIRRGRALLIIIGPALSLLARYSRAVVTSAGSTGQIRVIAAGVQRFLRFLAGAFALIALECRGRPGLGWRLTVSSSGRCAGFARGHLADGGLRARQPYHA
jgi:hypothetical protein